MPCRMDIPSKTPSGRGRSFTTGKGPSFLCGAGPQSFLSYEVAMQTLLTTFLDAIDSGAATYRPLSFQTVP